MRTLAIRLEDDLHTQLSALAQLENVTLTESIRQAIDAHLARLRTDKTLAAKAEALLAQIEQDTADRKQAISSLFAPEPTAAATGEPGGTGRSRATKAG